MEMEIKECPFCPKPVRHGCGDAVLCEVLFFDARDIGDNRRIVKCYRCGAHGPVGDSDEEAVEKWNKRGIR